MARPPAARPTRQDRSAKIRCALYQGNNGPGSGELCQPTRPPVLVTTSSATWPSPIWQAWAKMVGPSPSICSLERRAKASFGQHTSKRSLAHFQRITPHVVAIQLDQVEGVEKGVTVMASVADTVERGNAVVVAGDSFAIDDASVALRTSSGSRRRSSPFSSMRSKA